jgi:proton glutamate symport protein
MARGGWSVFSNFGSLIAAEYSALAALLVLFYLPLMLAARIPLLPFLSAIREPFAIAFATTASGAALPVALEKMEAFGVPRPLLNPVMPLGFCFNTAGSALHIFLSCLFLAQAVDVHLSAANQWTMLAVLLVMTKGVAAVPRTTLVVIIGVLTAWGIPLDALPVLLGVDAVLDMFRTSVNLIGNCLAPVLIARTEGIRFDLKPETPAQTR